MINRDKLKPVIEEYKTYFPMHWRNSINGGVSCKWEAVKCFREHWDIDATDFADMLSQALAKTGSLLNAAHFFAGGMLIAMARAEGETVRQMFRDLYDDTQDLAQRITDFEAAAEKIRAVHDDGTWNSHYQHANAISTYLWLRYPEKYYVYKYTVCHDVAVTLEADFQPNGNGAAENVVQCYCLYDEIRGELCADAELSKLFADTIPDAANASEYLNTVTIDFCYYLSQVYRKEKSAPPANDAPADSAAPSIWKISEGTDATGPSSGNKKIFMEHGVVVVHGETKALGTSGQTQGEAFRLEIKKGDFFYLCYASSVQLLGQFTSDEAIENPEMGGGWYERPYRVIAKSKSTTLPYKDKLKWWTPNANTTCVRVPDDEENRGLFEKLLLMPYFGMTLYELKTASTKPDKTYGKTEFVREVYMNEREFDILSALLRENKNLILQGAPGVGKTFAARRLAYAMMGEKDDSRVKLVQFHQNYSYEDFVMGYRPDGSGFKLTKGIFYNFCREAQEHPDKEYFFIIDEINRGNLSRIFGELLMLLEKDYRGTEISLAYNGEPFSVPKNLYLIGMMNTADRSLAIMDYALRRRFKFYDMYPAFGSEGFRTYQKRLDNVLFDALIEQIKSLNREIAGDVSLGRGFCIGHSYFCGRTPQTCTEEWMYMTVEYDILPMLREYWFDEPEKVQKWEERLRGVLNDE